jgi:hypothetical protein
VNLLIGLRSSVSSDIETAEGESVLSLVNLTIVFFQILSGAKR